VSRMSNRVMRRVTEWLRRAVLATGSIAGLMTKRRFPNTVVVQGSRVTEAERFRGGGLGAGIWQLTLAENQQTACFSFLSFDYDNLLATDDFLQLLTDNDQKYGLPEKASQGAMLE